MTIYKTSEWVSPGHPDKIADCISEYILDKLISIDEKVRYALECQIKGDVINLAGEITTKADVVEGDFQKWAKEAVAKIGYTREYQKKFGKDNTICDRDMLVFCNISKQSPDISKGVNKDAWGDQGIFFGYYSRETSSGHGIDYYLAKELGKKLYAEALKNDNPLGIDIKTQVRVEMEENGDFDVREIIVAIPTVSGKITSQKLRRGIKKIILDYFPFATGANLIINGTGAYHIHGPIGDSGTTGRKLVVDFYGSRSRIGGGSPWTKDGSKADLTLNMFAYEIAKRYFEDLNQSSVNIHHIETELSCCIGKQEVFAFITAFDENGVPVYRTTECGKMKPSELIKHYELNKPHFFELCTEGLFSKIK